MAHFNPSDYEPFTAQQVARIQIPPTPKRKEGYDVEYVDELLDYLAMVIDMQAQKLSGKQIENHISGGSELLENKTIPDNYDALPMNTGGTSSPTDLDKVVAEYDKLIDSYEDQQKELEAQLDEVNQDLNASTSQLSALSLQLNAANKTISDLQEQQKTWQEAQSSGNVIDSTFRGKHAGEVEEATSVIALASKVAEEAKDQANKDAEFIISQAHQEADTIRSNTESELSEIQRDIAELKNERAKFLMNVTQEIGAISETVDSFMGKDMPEGIEPLQHQ